MMLVYSYLWISSCVCQLDDAYVHVPAKPNHGGILVPMRKIRRPPFLSLFASECDVCDVDVLRADVDSMSSEQ